VSEVMLPEQRSLVTVVIDYQAERRAAVTALLALMSPKALSICEPAVPPESEIESFVARLGVEWIILLHVGNDRSVSLVRTLAPLLNQYHRLVLYSGGNRNNFNEIKDEVNSSICQHEFARCVPFVSKDRLLPLEDTLALLAPSLRSSSRSNHAPPTHEGTLAGHPRAQPPFNPAWMSAFEEERAHVSHDLFTNAFCAPLGFHCTDEESPRRRDLLSWARSEMRWWSSLRGPASRWSETRLAVEGVLRRAETLEAGRLLTPALQEVLAGARLAMDEIDPLMAKFAGASFEHAGLSDEEINSFWKSTDIIRGALQAIRVTDRGLDPELFTETPHDDTSLGSGKR
jgi:hypothetical protein